MNVVDPVPTTLAPTYRCPAHWSSYGNNCYFIFMTSSLNYDDAEAKCTSLGGDLASVHSSNENSFIMSLARDSKHDILLYIQIVPPKKKKKNDNQTFSIKNFQNCELT